MSVQRVLVLCFSLFFILPFSCSERPSHEEKPLAQVNDFVITQADFIRELSASARLRDDIGVSQTDREECLNTRIRKELLIQAAISQGLDKEDEFRQAIEKFWEQTLITELLRRESVRLEREVIVTKEELEDQYREMARNDPGTPPFGELVRTIEKNIRETKKTKAMEAWVDRLWKNAKITVHEENLKSLR